MGTLWGGREKGTGGVGSNQNAVLDLLSIDLEFSTKRRQIYQVGISDVKGDKLLDCFPQYSGPAKDQLFSRSWSNSFSRSFKGEIPYKVKMWELNEKYRGKGFALDGALKAQKVGEKLEKMIDKNKTFVTWGSSPFDVAYVREWLDTEGVDHSLPADDTVLLLYPEFKVILSEKLGNHCFKGRSFPLKLQVLFTVLYEGHDLVGLNHDALVDARQLSMLVRLFIDLCKPPNERTIFKGVLPIRDRLDETVFCGENSPIRQFGSTPSIKTHLQPEAKRQRETKENSPNKRSRLE